MSANDKPQDPLAFMKNIWSSMGITLPGMMVPTIDPDELDKRIKDLRAVEGWLRMNLNMLSASINTLEIQRATLATLRAFRQAAIAGETPAQPASPDASPNVNPESNPFVSPSMWPWNLMQPTPAESTPPEPAAGKPQGAKG